MAEYITIQNAIRTTWMILEGLGFHESENGELAKTVEEVFATAPAADVKPVVPGKWMPHKTKSGKNWWECSVCGFVSEHKAHHYYCPKCSADMSEGRADA